MTEHPAQKPEYAASDDDRSVLIPDRPAPDPWRVPASLWVWLALLIVTYALPKLTEWQGRGAKIVPQSSVATSAASLQEMFQAEYQTRLALSPIYSQSGTLSKTGAKKNDFATTATTAYRTLAVSKKGVASARKVLVLEHLQKKPLDDKFLTGVLAPNLAGRGEKPGAVGAEIALWRSLYGKSAAKDFDRKNTDLTVGRVKALKLGILEAQVLSDVYVLAGRTDEARSVKKSLQDKATFEVTRLALLVLTLLAAAVAGLAFLILFVTAWAGKKWNNVGRLRRETADSLAPLPALPFGGAMDVFVAYLAITRGIGLIAGMAPGLDAVSPVYLSASVYVGAGILASLYLLWRARSEKWDLSLFGIRTSGISDTFYGLAGYCAGLPIIFTLGAFNNAVFKKSDSALAPNPVLPMIAGEGSDIGRVVLFCLVAIAAPIFEELFFRGVLYSALKTRFSTVLAVVISAACFAVVHPMGDWLPIFGLGCVLATVRELRQSLVPGIVLHFCQNAVAFTMMSSLFGR